MSAPSSPSSRGKRVTRRTMLSRRDGMTAAERATASAQIAARATDLVTGQAKLVAIYASKGSEVDTAALDAALRARGITVVYPSVVDGQRELVFRAATPGELLPSRFGLREPAFGDEVPLASIEVMFVPGLAFDRDGWRVGWGHGHYDATLAAAPNARAIGLAFECQVVDSVEHEPHDARLHHVLTEIRLYP